jgi:hypothetical protein
MALRNFLMGASSSLFAAGIAWLITEHNLIPGLVIAAAGIIGFIATYLFTKKSSPPAPPPLPVSVHQENKQEFNPTFISQFNPSIQIGLAHPTEAERHRIETLVVEFLKQYRKPDRSLPQPLSVIVKGTRRSDHRLTELDIVEALNSLCAKNLIIRKPMEIEGGYVYWLL